eukprot:403346516
MQHFIQDGQVPNSSVPEDESENYDQFLQKSNSHNILDLFLVTQQQRLTKAQCDNCYQRAFSKIQIERKSMDRERKGIEQRLNNSLIELEYQKTKKDKEECKQYFLLIALILVIVGNNGCYFKQTSSDKNYDPDWTKVPEMADTKKSYNIAANPCFQKAVVNQNLRSFAQNRRTNQTMNQSKRNHAIKVQTNILSPRKQIENSCSQNLYQYSLSPRSNGKSLNQSTSHIQFNASILNQSTNPSKENLVTYNQVSQQSTFKNISGGSGHRKQISINASSTAQLPSSLLQQSPIHNQASKVNSNQQQNQRVQNEKKVQKSKHEISNPSFQQSNSPKSFKNYQPVLQGNIQQQYSPGNSSLKAQERAFTFGQVNYHQNQKQIMNISTNNQQNQYQLDLQYEKDKNERSSSKKNQSHSKSRSPQKQQIQKMPSQSLKSTQGLIFQQQVQQYGIDLDDEMYDDDDESNVDERSSAEIQINKEMIHTGPTLFQLQTSDSQSIKSKGHSRIQSQTFSQFNKAATLKKQNHSKQSQQKQPSQKVESQNQSNTLKDPQIMTKHQNYFNQ